MEDLDRFVADTVARLRAADTALHNGNAEPRIVDTWSHADPVTLFGAAFSARGWEEIGPVFDRLGERFSDCKSFDIEVVAAGVSDGLGYIVAIERTNASVNSEPQSYALRVTQIFRREGDKWKIVHRHADTYEGSGQQLVAELTR